MKSKAFFLLAGAALVTVFFSGCAAIDAHHRALFGKQPTHSNSVPNDDSDPISGVWDVTFHVNESIMPGTFTFKLEETKVTGNAYSDRTGEGTIRDGKWEVDKLSFAVDFKKHSPVLVRGALEDGRLAGDLQHPDGPSYKWEAKKK